MEESTKLLIYDRRTIATMNATKRVMDKLAGYSVAGGGISALSSVMAGGKIDLLLPLIAALVGAITLAVRELLSYLVSAAVVRNPINLSQFTTISQPAPIETPKPSVLPADAEVHTTS